MNCSQARDRLPDLLYPDAPRDGRGEVEKHLGGCPDCRREMEDLRRVRGLLRAAPAPPEVAVDVAALYRAAADRQARRLRRWRRAAAALAGVAALLLVGLASGLEVRVGADQVVLRWGAAAPQEPLPAPAPSAPVPSHDDRTRVLSELVQALALEVQRNDVDRQQELARLRGELDDLRRQDLRRWALTERDLAALQAAQLVLIKKGGVQ